MTEARPLDARPVDGLAPYVPALVADWLADEPHRDYRQVDGTSVFADVSGFTALTERLAARGKAGAEEMGDLLNVVFEQVLTAAYDFGASLIKWGGDAVLLLFDGEDHAQRAARAAWGMQAAMRPSAGCRRPPAWCGSACRSACTPHRSTSCSSAAGTAS